MKLNLRQSGSFIGIAGMACTGFLNFASGLVAPPWGVVVLCTVWLMMLVLSIKWFMTHPLRVLVMPVISLAIWFGLITFGDIVLGWTA
jgi:hypothetical protein